MSTITHEVFGDMWPTRLEHFVGVVVVGMLQHGDFQHIAFPLS